MLSCSVEFEVPKKVLYEALTVLFSKTVISLTPTSIQDLVELLPYAKTAIIYKLVQMAREELYPDLIEGDDDVVERVSARYNITERELIDAFPSVVVRDLGSRSNDDDGGGNSKETEEEKKISHRDEFFDLLTSGDKLALRCRHGMILLSRSPSCPAMMVIKQATPQLQLTYDQMKPLLERAGFSADDLSVQGQVSFLKKKKIIRFFGFHKLTIIDE